MPRHALCGGAGKRSGAPGAAILLFSFGPFACGKDRNHLHARATQSGPRGSGVLADATAANASLDQTVQKKNQGGYPMQATERHLTADDIIRMGERVDTRLRPLCRLEGFDPNGGVYRLGDMGYVGEEEYLRAFEKEPEWARDCYMLHGNEPDEAGYWAEAYEEGGTKRLEEELEDMFDLDHADTVFWTEADENGRMG